MKWTNAYFLICIFLCAIFFNKPGGFAQNSVLCKGDSLFSAGNFFEAAIAFERAYYFAPNNTERIAANLKKANALKQQGEFSKAFSDLQRSLPTAIIDSLRIEVLYETAICAYLAGNYAHSISILSQLIYQYPHAIQFKEFFLLKAMVLVKLEQWNELSVHINQMALQRQPTLQKDQVMTQLRDLLNPGNQPKLRNPERASLWSTIIPGSGHLYAGSPGKGVINGLSQLVSLGGAFVMGVNHLYFSGFIIGLGAFQSFYFGGIKQAANLAQQNNIKKMNDYQAKIETLLFDIYQMP